MTSESRFKYDQDKREGRRDHKKGARDPQMRFCEQQQLMDNRVCERPWAGGMAEKKGREQRNERREQREERN